jgi:catechol 2,3-dioxygenase-like lactoylglutathione lyase family enzyme
MKAALHHAHLFAADIDESLRFYCSMFGAEVLFDTEMAGSRNVMIAIGGGKLNFYDQPPRDAGRGPVHHLGIETDDLEALVERMKAKGVEFRKPIRDLGLWKYVMVEGPDGLLIELFEIAEGTGDREWRGRISAL